MRSQFQVGPGPGPDTRPILILIPIHDDWEALRALLGRLDDVVRELTPPISVLLIDDGSIEPIPEDLAARPFEALETVEVLTLRRNLGHQRALAVGLCYVEAHRPCRAIVVMDGDGEDDPADVPRLVRELDRLGGSRIIFAERARRSESRIFRIFYVLYKVAHRLLTGLPVRFGNFSVLPAHQLTRLVVSSDLWNHYAAAIVRARLPFATLPTQRARRLAGQSRMNFVALVTHGLSAISVFSERIGVRLLIAVSILFLATLAALLATLALKLATTLPIPGWATYTAGLLLVLMTQQLTLIFVFVFVILGGRDSSSFLPIRDYVHFVAGQGRLYPTDESDTVPDPLSLRRG